VVGSVSNKARHASKSGSAAAPARSSASVTPKASSTSCDAERWLWPAAKNLPSASL
jgi:hypothetical protein